MRVRGSRPAGLAHPCCVCRIVAGIGDMDRRCGGASGPCARDRHFRKASHTPRFKVSMSCAECFIGEDMFVGAGPGGSRAACRERVDDGLATRHTQMFRRARVSPTARSVECNRVDWRTTLPHDAAIAKRRFGNSRLRIPNS